MSDKIERFKQLRAVLVKIHEKTPLIFNDNDVEAATLKMIRELRQIIECLRRIVDDEEPPIEVHSLRDAMKLNRDELAYLAWQFFQWGNGEDCPVNVSHCFPCQYRRKIKAECEENLRNGDLDEEGMKDQKEHGYYANAFCDEDGIGCWAEYYLWCYRNEVNPLNGKKEEK